MRQLTNSVAWQSSAVIVAGIVAGIPAGVALGRWLWILFAEQIYAVPSATVPVLSLCYVALGALVLVLANLVAAFPGRSASRTRPRSCCARSDYSSASPSHGRRDTAAACPSGQCRR